MIPGDIFLKNGHVMMYVGMSGSKYAVFEADAIDSKCAYNTYYSSDLSAYGSYRFTGWTENDDSCSCLDSYAGIYICTSRTTLNIRSEHNTSSTVLGSINSGAEVYVSRANGEWAHVEYNGISGYASMAYLAPKSAPSLLELPTGATLDNGYYAIRAAKDTTYACGVPNSDDNGVSVVLRWYNEGADYQAWKFTYLGNGLYSIENYGSKKYLDVSDYGVGNDVVQYRGSYVQDNEKWYVVEQDGGYYLVPYCQNTTALDIDNGVMSTGTNVHLWEQTRGNTQLLVLTPLNRSESILSLPSSQTLPEGYYSIRAAKNMNYAVGTANENRGESVHLRSYAENAQLQTWHFLYLGEGLYSIENYGSGQYLDVSEFGAGNDVVQYRGTVVQDNEKWYVVPSNGGYYLVPYCQPDKALDIDNGIMSHGTNVHLWTQTQGETQFLKLTPRSISGGMLSIPSKPTIKEGIYKIRAHKNTNYAVGVGGNNINDNGTSVQLRSYADSATYQNWLFTHLGNGLYSIQNVGSGKFMDVSEYGAGDDIVQFRYSDGQPSSNEKWYVIWYGNAYYIVPAVQPDKALDIDNGIMSNGTNVHLWTQTCGETQQLDLDFKGESGNLSLPTGRTLDDGTYSIRAAKNNQYALGVDNDSLENGANIQLWEYSSSNQFEHFKFVHLGDGLYSIENCGSGKFLNVSEWGQGDNVVQFRNGSPANNEKWYVVPDSGDYYLVPYCQSTKALDIDNGTMANGTNIHLWDQTKGDTQRVSLIKKNNSLNSVIRGLNLFFIQGNLAVNVVGSSGSLINNTDYVIDQVVDNNDGTASVTVTGIGDYSDTYTTTVEIEGQAVPMTVTYDPNGGELSDTSRIVYQNEPYGEQPVPVLTGYSFDGWYTAKDSNERVADTTIVTSGADHTLYAHWRANIYHINYQGNGATAGYMENDTFAYDTNETLSPNLFSRTGYTFAGWNTKTDGTGTTYADGATVRGLSAQFDATVVLYAQWNKVQATVAYDANGGTVSINSRTVYLNESYGQHPVPVKAGHTFEGWFTDATAGEQVTETTIVTEGANHTLYAHWRMNTYHVNYNGNGADAGNMETDTFNYSTNSALSLNQYSRTGYSFTGWNTKADGTGTAYADGAAVTGLSGQDDATVILYAQWSKIQVTVTYDANGGTVSMNSRTVYLNEPYGQHPVPVLAGNTFEGWFTGAVSGEQVTENTVVTNGTAHTLYARWSADSYQISYNGNGADAGSMGTDTFTYNTNASLSLNQYSRTGFSFAGWNSKADGTGTAFYDGAVLRGRPDQFGATNILYAQWIKMFDITLLNGQSIRIPATYGQVQSIESSNESIVSQYAYYIGARRAGNCVVTVKFDNCTVRYSVCVTNENTGFTLPDELKEIEEEAFSGIHTCFVEIPEAVLHVRRNAFASGDIDQIRVLSYDTVFDPEAVGTIKPLIICYSGSKAETFAIQQNLPYAYFDSSLGN